jgi:hypothetical protein
MPPRSPARRRKPIGQPTRGKTAPNRLRKTDTFLAVAYPDFVRRMAGLYVDLGYGAYPVTSVETLHRLRRLNPSLHVLGVEIDPQRVEEAQPFAEPGLEFRLGGFNLPLQPGEDVSVIRAFNVLRQYDEAEVAEALAALSASLTEGGLIIEGTSDPRGRLLTFNLYQKQTPIPAPCEAPSERSAEGSPVGPSTARKSTPLRSGCSDRGRKSPPPFAKGANRGGTGWGLTRIAFVLAPTLHADFLPRQFQAVLPKNFIHHAEQGGAIDRFFTAWHAAWQRARAHAIDRRQMLTESAVRLADDYGYHVDRRPALLRRGFLWLGPEWPEVSEVRG